MSLTIQFAKVQIRVEDSGELQRQLHGTSTAVSELLEVALANIPIRSNSQVKTVKMPNWTLETFLRVLLEGNQGNEEETT